MALKPDRLITQDDISYFMNQPAERGGVVCASGTPGSGHGMDDSGQVCAYFPDPSGKMPLGILTYDVVDIDTSRQIVNPYKGGNEVLSGDKVNIVTIGTLVTNRVVGTSATGAMPAVAYVGPTGFLTQSPATGSFAIGQFLTRKDADGYCKVRINVPQASVYGHNQF